MVFVIYPVIAAVTLVLAQDLPHDSGKSGPPLELVHRYYDLYPQGWSHS